jgi:hypothetical protein
MAADQVRLGIGGLAIAAIFGTAASLGLSALLLLIIVAR